MSDKKPSRLTRMANDLVSKSDNISEVTGQLVTVVRGIAKQCRRATQLADELDKLHGYRERVRKPVKAKPSLKKGTTTEPMKAV